MKIGYLRALALEESNAAQTKLLKSLKVKKYMKINKREKLQIMKG